MSNNGDGTNTIIKPPVYDGKEPYIFVSYSFEDEYAVFPEIKRFQDMGYNVYYGYDGIENSEKYVNALRKCSVFVVFFTPNSANCDRVTEEIYNALDNEKNILPIYLVETELDSLLEFKLIDFNPISKYNLEPNKYFSRCNTSFLNFNLKPNRDPTNSKLIPGIGREPLTAYRGNNSYMFVSYAHKDSKIVFPEIKRFQDMGYNVWYDEGIGAGNEWLNDVVKHLKGSDVVVMFITNNSVASKNVKKEFKYSINKEKHILPIYLEDFDEIKMDDEWEYELHSIQGILKTTLDEEEYIFKFTEAFDQFEFKPNVDYGYEDFVLDKSDIDNLRLSGRPCGYAYDAYYADIESKAISKYVNDFFEILVFDDDYYNENDYKNLLKSSIDVFLQEKTILNAYEVYWIFFNIYQIIPSDKSNGEEVILVKNMILDLIDVIKDCWCDNYDVDDVQKDIFIHSVNVFILGLAVYSQNEEYRQAFRSYVENSDYENYYQINHEVSHEEFLYRWGITSLLHDMYYPFEKMEKFARPATSFYKDLSFVLHKNMNSDRINNLNNIVKLPPYNFTDLYARRYPETRFLDLYKPTDLLAHRISQNFKFDNKNFNLLKKHLNYFFIDWINDNEFEEHGLVSALLVLDSYAYQIQEYKNDRDLFFYPILDSAVAIFLQDYYNKTLQNKPFKFRKLNPYQSPLAYLLILCDNILEFIKSPQTVFDNNVNIISDLQINDKYFDITYSVNSSSFKSNEFNLKSDLDIDSIFLKGLRMQVDSDNLNNNPEIFVLSNNRYNNSLEHCEKLAQAIDNKQNSKVKLSNIKKAKSMLNELNMVGYEITVASDERKSIMEFSDDDSIYLAMMNHEEWCEEKMNPGWIQRGDVRDDSNLIHEDMVPWDDLTTEIQMQYIENVKNIPRLIHLAGFEIVPSRFRMLLEKLFDSYDGENVETMPYYIKKLKLDLIIEVLSALNYFVVDLEYLNSPIYHFDDYSLEYLAERYHNKWYHLSMGFGWNYDRVYDSSLKTSPNLVPWYDLDYETKESIIRIFRNLPEICAEVGLKIITNTY